MDEAKLVKLPERVATIVVGNPLIADASLQPGGLAVLTGKGYGATNFIALDRKGNALFEKIIEVRGALNTVVVLQGRQSRDLQLRAQLPAGDCTWRRSAILQPDAGSDHDPHHAGDLDVGAALAADPRPSGASTCRATTRVSARRYSLAWFSNR